MCCTVQWHHHNGIYFNNIYGLKLDRALEVRTTGMSHDRDPHSQMVTWLIDGSNNFNQLVFPHSSNCITSFSTRVSSHISGSQM